MHHATCNMHMRMRCTCAAHAHVHVHVHAPVQVSLMSMMVLEGWQFRLAKELPIFDSVKVALGLTLALTLTLTLALPPNCIPDPHPHPHQGRSGRLRRPGLLQGPEGQGHGGAGQHRGAARSRTRGDLASEPSAYRRQSRVGRGLGRALRAPEVLSGAARLAGAVQYSQFCVPVSTVLAVCVAVHGHTSGRRYLSILDSCVWCGRRVGISVIHSQRARAYTLPYPLLIPQA